MDIQINKKNGESFTLSEHGIVVKDFIVSSIPLEGIYDKVEGGNKQIDYGATYGSRTITVPFTLLAYDLIDFPLLRDTLFGLVHDAESFYIRELRRPKKLNYAFVDTTEAPRMDPQTENRLVGGKRYLVRLQSTFDIEQIALRGEGELIFETTELPFAESVGTTADIDRNGISANEELWGFGMGLMSVDETLTYTHTGTRFRVFNAGNVNIHPFEQELKITITNLNAPNFRMRNLTNGSEFEIIESVTESQTIVIDGANVASNGLAFLRNTSMEYIELSPGWNEFQLSRSATVKFDFRFYYL